VAQDRADHWAFRVLGLFVFLEPAMKLVTLKKRHEFLRIRKGQRFHSATFVLEGKRRVPEDADRARFGFTATKRLGGAVQRNRIRRRLKAAVVAASSAAQAGTDYVVIARAAASEAPFLEMVDDLGKAFRSIERRLSETTDQGNDVRHPKGRRRGSGQRKKDATNTASVNKAPTQTR
jgi:ribonuclease P protein component